MHHILCGIWYPASCSITAFERKRDPFTTLELSTAPEPNLMMMVNHLKYLIKTITIYYSASQNQYH